MEGWLEFLQQSMSELVSVSGPDSRRLFKMGAKSEAFVRSTLDAAGKHAALLPGGIRANMERDAALRQRLRPILAKLQSLLSLVEGSYKLAGADLMKNGSAVYQILRLNGYQEGLNPLLEELSSRFARPSRKRVQIVPAATAVAKESGIKAVAPLPASIALRSVPPMTQSLTQDVATKAAGGIPAPLQTAGEERAQRAAASPPAKALSGAEVPIETGTAIMARSGSPEGAGEWGVRSERSRVRL